MESFGIASVAGITVICYLMGLLIKNLPLDNKWIPSLAGLLGGVLGILGWPPDGSLPAEAKNFSKKREFFRKTSFHRRKNRLQ